METKRCLCLLFAAGLLLTLCVWMQPRQVAGKSYAQYRLMRMRRSHCIAQIPPIILETDIDKRWSWGWGWGWGWGYCDFWLTPTLVMGFG